MAQVTLRGTSIATSGELPAVGSEAPEFTLTTSDLGSVSLSELQGQRVVLNIFPSIDTPVCASSVRTFNERAADLDNTRVLSVSADLPFAHARFCGTEGIENATGSSTFRGDFADAYGVRMTDGPLAELCARAVVVIEADGTVAYTQLVPSIGEEPDYDAALAAL
jgi:thiol peroxidase